MNSKRKQKGSHPTVSKRAESPSAQEDSVESQPAEHEVSNTRPATYCLLSEFNSPWLRWIIYHPNWIAVVALGWTILVLALGDLVGGNAMAISYTATANPVSGQSVSVSAANMYGHLSTANAAPYQLLVVPILLLMVRQFHVSAARAFMNLHERGILRTAKGSWDAIISRRSARFKYVLWLFFPILAWCLYTQLTSIDPNGSKLGFVQSPNHHLWVERFNNLENGIQKLEKIDEQEISVSDSLAKDLFAELNRRNLLDDKRLQGHFNYSDGKPVSLRLKESLERTDPVVSLSARNVWPEKPCLRIWKVTEYFEELLKTRGNEDSRRTAYLAWFKTFIIFDQIRIAVLFTFMAWLLAKFTFYLVQLYCMLPKDDIAGRGKTIFLKPWARDGQGKFGLGDLFAPYNLLVLCIGIGSLYFAVNFPDQGGLKAITRASGAGTGAARVAHLFIVGASIAGLLIGPLWAYPRRLRKWLEASRLRKLRSRQAETRAKFKNDPAVAEKEWMELGKEESEILSQSTWPKGDKTFQLSIALIFAVLLLPLSVAGDFLPGGLSKYARLPQYLRAKCKEVAAEIYHLAAKQPFKIVP